VIVAFSGQSRSLAASGFNDRVTECRDAARRLLRLAGLASHDGSRLADVPRPVFDGLGHRLPPVLRRRADHYFGEIERVEAGEVAWRRGDLAAFGALVNASGESSIVNYESGTAELVALFELLRMSEGVFGSRFSGAGFGGSCIALADPDASNEVVEAVAARYAELHSEAAAAAAFSVCRSAGPPQLLRMEA
jgi:galactokinase/galacturonokinase